MVMNIVRRTGIARPGPILRMNYVHTSRMASALAECTAGAVAHRPCLSGGLREDLLLARGQPAGIGLGGRDGAVALVDGDGIHETHGSTSLIHRMDRTRQTGCKNARSAIAPRSPALDGKESNLASPRLREGVVALCLHREDPLSYIQPSSLNSWRPSATRGGASSRSCRYSKSFFAIPV